MQGATFVLRVITAKVDLSPRTTSPSAPALLLFCWSGLPSACTGFSAPTSFNSHTTITSSITWRTSGSLRLCCNHVRALLLSLLGYICRVTRVFPARARPHHHFKPRFSWSCAPCSVWSQHRCYACGPYRTHRARRTPTRSAFALLMAWPVFTTHVRAGPCLSAFIARFPSQLHSSSTTF